MSETAFPYYLVARAAHEVNRAYCESIGEQQERWERMSAETQASSIEAVKVHVAAATSGRLILPQEEHMRWMKSRLADGWKLAPMKNTELKLHPCLVPYDQLPETQRAKDYLHIAIISTFIELLLLDGSMREMRRLAREGLVASLGNEPPLTEAELARLLNETDDDMVDVLPDGSVVPHKEPERAKVGDSGQLNSAGNDPAGHALLIPSLRAAHEGSTTERAGGSDGPDSGSEQG